MSRCHFMLALLLAICCAERLNAADVADQGNAAKRPNIVMIVSDDHAWSDYSFMGHPQVRTPNIDRLAGESLTFTRGYVPSSLCCPS